ncbi:hypothetical protein [Gordonia amicalis]|uniref:hypothetical protein n=1 Tax=Gordonia amicalis TaxID=89053 RepID=UPI003B8A83FA
MLRGRRIPICPGLTVPSGSLTFTDRLIGFGITPSVGTVGDSYDNAITESVNASYKTELIREGQPWRTVRRAGRVGHLRMGLVVQPATPP